MRNEGRLIVGSNRLPVTAASVEGEARLSLPKKSSWLAVLAGVSLFGVMAHLWTRVQSQQRQNASMVDQLDRMTKRMNMLTEVIEAASARAVRAEENARTAAEACDKAQVARAEAEQQSVEARAEAQRSAEQVRVALAEAQKVRQQREQDLDRLQKALGALVETRRTALGLVMNLGADAIQFDFDRDTLRTENRELLSRIAGVLLSAKGYSIYVYGHTDDVGSDEYNRDLSERRARTVRDYLVEAGLDSSIVTTRAYGKSSPRVLGTTPEARAMNRRVEVGIVDMSFDYAGEVR
jgi:outer membrane protein OmpA-like peptidoglycan-associated protein